MTAKIDLKRAISSYRARSGVLEVIEVPDLQYLMVDGHGDPNSSPEFAAALRALYPVAYSLKFASKQDLDRDHVVMPLEGLWWAEDMAAFTGSRDKTRWDWTLMIMVPDWIERAMFASAVEQVRARSAPARLDDVRLETLREGRCVQTLHVGPFDQEAEVLERMHHGFIPDQGLRMAGKHHEIYLTDVRRVRPDRRRTIVRQPVELSPGDAGR